MRLAVLTSATTSNSTFQPGQFLAASRTWRGLVQLWRCFLKGWSRLLISVEKEEQVPVFNSQSCIARRRGAVAMARSVSSASVTDDVARSLVERSSSDTVEMVGPTAAGGGVVGRSTGGGPRGWKQ